ncbi:iron complex transport system ATP-binding protein [Planomicrobium soli]|uniref:Iron complex transport system ATP-binding protein n=1 Tax=Planomicrobium soli TaxID=1176648 RepID=A0A2P8H3G5_9BACL|nr:ABC transporter ATP-binding protein [Planomicrobium soli]PSL40764.1 iron complex transport system ATP-binding protein [Planomicrobium soli]
MKILDLENISRRRGDKTLLKNVNWQIEQGEHWILYGMNGAGKTSLLDLINAYFFPTQGKISVLGMEFGKTYLAEKLRKQIGFVSSSLQHKIPPSDNAYEVVLSGAFASIGLFEETTAEMDKRGVEILKKLGCLDYANRPYETLSQGEKQRVLIGRALMAEPALLVLDEPTNGLDFIAREELLEAIERITKQPDAPTVIYVTHHIEEILPVFDKTLLLKDGEVFASGNMEELITSEGLSKFFEIPVTVMWHNNRPLLSKAIGNEITAK